MTTNKLTAHIAIAIFYLSLTACVPVQPWERGQPCQAANGA
ncbi:MAG: hypothetical protein ABL884_11105 [Methyloglobulus sp.]